MLPSINVLYWKVETKKKKKNVLFSISVLAIAYRRTYVPKKIYIYTYIYIYIYKKYNKKKKKTKPLGELIIMQW